MPSPVIHVNTIALTREQIAVIAWSAAVKVNSEVQSKVAIPRVEALLDLACRTACENVFNKGEWERQFDTYDLVTEASGQLALDSDIMPRSIRASSGGSVFVTGYGYASFYSSLEDIYQNDWIVDVAKFTVLGGNKSTGVLYVADGQGNPIPSIAVTIKAARYFLFPDFPEQMKDDLIYALRDLILETYKQDQGNGSANA